MTPARWFAFALFLPALAVASHESPVDPRVLPSQRAFLDKGAGLIAQGDVAQGSAYLDLAQSRVALKVAVDCGTDACSATDKTAVEQAARTWNEAGADVTLVNSEEANVRLHIRPAVGASGHLAGHANWVKRVVRTGYQRYQPRVSADLTVGTTDSRGRALSSDALAYVTAHELGHVMGLDDTARTGELMGPNQVDHPVLGPSQAELRSLAALREQAELVARVVAR